MVYFEYKSVQEAKNRKFLLALITYNFVNKNYCKSQNLTPTDNSIDIQKIVDDTFFLIPFPKEED